jgi:enterochelin esterase family protein
MLFPLLWLYAWLAVGVPAQNVPSADTLLQRARQEGTPLVDLVEGDARYVQVTFVWRGSAETTNIAVVGTFLKAPIVAMTRIGDSDMWYLTTRVPAGARFTYWLAENTPMVTEGPQVGAMLDPLQPDPLNPRRTCAPMRRSGAADRLSSCRALRPSHGSSGTRRRPPARWFTTR